MGKMPVYEVLGVRKAKSKTSERVGVTFWVKEPFTEYEKANGADCLGMKCRQAFIYEDVMDGVVLKPGDKIHMIYDAGFEGKAQLMGIIPVK